MKEDSNSNSISNEKINTYISLFALTLILIAALGLRLYHLGLPGLWLDEQGQALTATKSLPEVLSGVQKHHGAAPLDYLVTSVTVRFTHDLFFLRLPAALWSALSVYWIYRLGNLLDSRRIGLMAALLAAVNVFLLRYSQELRFYSLFILLTLISTELAWRAWKTNRLKSWLYYGISILALFYTHYFGLLMVGFHGLWMVLETWEVFHSHNEDFRSAKQKMVRFFITALAAFFLFLPWILYDLPREEGLPWAPAPSFNKELWKNILFEFSGRAQIWWVWMIFALIGMVAAIRKHWPTGLVLSVMLIGMPLLVVGIDRTQAYFFHPRQIIVLLPFYLVLIACGIDAMFDASSRPNNFWSKQIVRGGIVLTLGVMVLFTLPPLKEYYEFRQILREDIGLHPLSHVVEWRGAAEIVSENWEDGDRIVFLNKSDGNNLRFYLPTSLRRQGTIVPDLQSLKDVSTQDGFIWLIFSSAITKSENAEEITAWLNQQPTINFQLIGGIKIIVLQAGGDKQKLWQERVSQFNIPGQAELWGAYAQGIRDIDHQRALQAFEKAADLTIFTRPRRDYYILGGYAIPSSKTPKDVNVKTKAGYLMEAGFDAVFAGDIPRALDDLAQAQALEPTDSEIAIRTGMALLKGNRPEDATEMLEHARDELDGGGFWLFFFLGNAYRRTGQYHKAIDAYNQALTVRTEAHDVRFFIAESYKELGEDGLARQWYQDYLDHALDGPFAKQAHKYLLEH